LKGEDTISKRLRLEYRGTVMKQSQCNKIINHIKEYGSITSLEAFRYYGCTRLSGRIFDLKKKGYNISSELETVLTRDGTARVAVYRLIE